ncbi:conserved hypothetical protein, secreted [Candidatus Desulfofervidus auxilii]|uniref:Uncharacterized protein n=1 Tax=Desulfofervidus auxilii TaxID=1621989 RepID=A0A7U4TGZ1_DESA2|nr:hypothetical protein [Candidatus Desulfofervidus auxilii]AMM41294.1 conserved hypothetical protein, secreted [Candidatus Desulfofervidus auxilii]
MRYLFLCILVLLPLQASSEISQSPLLNYYVSEETKSIEAVGPFFSYQKGPEFKTFAFRPFFSYEKTPQGLSWDILYPLIRYRRDNWGKRFQLLPLINQEERHQGESYKEYFPVFWGKTKTGEKYGGIFPIYGKYKQRFDRDEIKFVLWPFYISSKKADSHTYRFLWPFFSYHKGAGRKGFKFLPLFGYDRKQGEFSKYFFLWPIFLYQKTKLNTSEPHTYFSVFPFYISDKSPVSYSYTFLWPFFRVHHYKEYRHYDFPWPILGWSKGKDYYAFRFLPFYIHEKDKEKESTYWLYPLYKHQIEQGKKETIVTDFFLVFDRYERRYDKTGNQTLKLARFWPFYYYKAENNHIKAYFPAILPIEHPGFERNIAPILRIYYHERNAQKSYTNWFWGLYTHKKNKERETYHLFPLFNYEKKEEEKKLSFLAGILQIRSLEQKKYIKIFYFLKL